MTDIIPASMTIDPWPEITRVIQFGNNVVGPESALRLCVEANLRITGDAEAYKRPSSLKDGEQHFFVGGIFLVTPGKESHILVADWGFPTEQYRLKIPLDTGHPGWVWKYQVPLILENTDDYSNFKQILRTSRMGSAIYAPMMWQGTFLGQMIAAAQARYTFRPADLDRITTMAAVATSLYVAKGGREWLQAMWQDTID